MNEWCGWAGARWWKFDFHTHTPASRDWKGERPSPADWLLAHMRAGIDCVAVTDHNTGEWVDKLKVALAELERDRPEGYRSLCIFPGVEISVQGGVHLLAIFDPASASDNITGLLAEAGYKGTPGDSDAVTTKSFADVIGVIHSRDGLAIPAHVDRESGLFRALSGNTLGQALQAGHIHAMEVVDPAFEKPRLYLDEKLNWTELCGSDSHCLERTGKRFSWVKMGTPSFEGLRLALLDGELSVKRLDSLLADLNKHGRNVIESITVRKAKYMGRSEDFVLRLNPWLNAIIGGRGTGKSTLVEFMRLALRRERELPESLRKEFKKYQDVCRSRGDEGLLTQDSATGILYRKDGEGFSVQWNANGDHAPIMREEDESPVPGDVRSLFPVTIYSQKQIFELSRDSLALLVQVDKAPQLEKRSWQENHDKLERHYLELRARERRRASSLETEASLKGDLEEVGRKMKVFEDQGHAGVLREYQQSRRQRNAIERWSETWADAGARIRKLAEGIVPEPLESFLDMEDLDKDSRDEALSRARRVSKEFQKIDSELLSPATDRAERVIREWAEQREGSTWARRAQDAESAHAALLERLSKEGVSDLNEYATLVQRKQQIEDSLGKIEAQRKELDRVSQQAHSILGELSESSAELNRRRKEFLQRTLHNNPYVKIEIVAHGSPMPEIEREFRDRLQCEEGGFDKDIALLLDELQRAADRGRQLKRLKAKVREIAESKGEFPGVHDQRFARRLRRLKDRQPEVLDRLDIWYPEDGLEVSYSPKGDGLGFRHIETGSPGQRTAALLAFLISYGDDPIILDQPEDDLDNALISSLIVSQLRGMKQKRQVIVVTHNPNIVVNGDAELVAALQVEKGQTRSASGCLQEQNIRDNLCEIMEGGREALERRYQRIVGKRGDA